MSSTSNKDALERMVEKDEEQIATPRIQAEIVLQEESANDEDEGEEGEEAKESDKGNVIIT